MVPLVVPMTNTVRVARQQMERRRCLPGPDVNVDTTAASHHRKEAHEIYIRDLSERGERFSHLSCDESSTYESIASN